MHGRGDVAQWSAAFDKIGGGSFVAAQWKKPPPISHTVIGPTYFLAKAGKLTPSSSILASSRDSEAGAR